MKTILLLIALGLATGGYAQNKNCACKHKYAKTTHHKLVKENNWNDNGVLPQTVNEVTIVHPVCFISQKDGIVVSECPDIFYDEAGNASYLDNSKALEYKTESSFSGYYPVKKDGTVIQHQEDQAINCKPANTAVDQGTYNAMCFWNCGRR